MRKFIDLAPWCHCWLAVSRWFEQFAVCGRYVSSSKQETCLCKACENFTCYDKALKEVLETMESQLLHKGLEVLLEGWSC